MSSRDRLSVDLGPLKAVAHECAARDGVPTAAWVRRAIDVLARQAGAQANATQPVRRAAPGAGRVKFGAMLSANGSAALHAGAAEARLSKAEFLERLLTGQVVANRTAVLAQLRAVAEGLAATHRDLARLQSLVAASAAPNHAELAQAARAVRQQAKAVSKAMATLTTTRRSAAQRKERK
jgi:hypothetical protein